MTKPLEFLDHLKVSFPTLIDQIQKLREYYDNKLWHQLTTQIEEFIENPQLLQKKELINLYELFIKDFETKLKPLSLVSICIVISSQLDNEGSMKFIQQISEKVKKDKSGYILSLSFIASRHLDAHQITEAKQTIETAREELKGITGLEPIVYATFYQVCTNYCKLKKSYGEFYQNALLYLSYTRLETLSVSDQQTLAFELGIAAIIGENVYSFGDLIVHPILRSLENTEAAWLIHLLKAFNIGDIAQYEQLLAKYRDSISKVADLNNNQQQSLQKIAILSLLDLAFRTPSDKRILPFQTIAQTTKLPLGDIEYLLMKALSLNLIKGNIDQIDQNIMITWVTPRVLDLNQIATMKGKILDWTSKTQMSLGILETDTVDLVV
ncbi:26S proteasome non-ATPase regulatory subunit 13 [Heterostelium album PN500]|uniref:26S proteasome non-ATPase regulatory subunit 13 n=1 Tax=Heterostelium pallidum (strain ATCC 26659 / Pp 5 / PN500) TaxID=670386 RepID=D3BBM0_HETP5|nr:26S proteasome non-ATPase regulatory subunit 13 [Heterostelium album PN500]EFA81053.1 26S proteasome non-ATPase regulatory subunit 13 [Heterostelium album PN500]|eukprot:XP_020433171.1 26S proteasome non-ATPase regulatory subunit 13 [Heterostelium album PN500]